MLQCFDVMLTAYTTAMVSFYCLNLQIICQSGSIQTLLRTGLAVIFYFIKVFFVSCVVCIMHPCMLL